MYYCNPKLINPVSLHKVYYTWNANSSTVICYSHCPVMSYYFCNIFLPTVDYYLWLHISSPKIVHRNPVHWKSFHRNRKSFHRKCSNRDSTIFGEAIFSEMCSVNGFSAGEMTGPLFCIFLLYFFTPFYLDSYFLYPRFYVTKSELNKKKLQS